MPKVIDERAIKKEQTTNLPRYGIVIGIRANGSHLCQLSISLCRLKSELWPFQEGRLHKHSYCEIFSIFIWYVCFFSHFVYACSSKSQTHNIHSGMVVTETCCASHWKLINAGYPCDLTFELDTKCIWTFSTSKLWFVYWSHTFTLILFNGWKNVRLRHSLGIFNGQWFSSLLLVHWFKRLHSNFKQIDLQCFIPLVELFNGDLLLILD